MAKLTFADGSGIVIEGTPDEILDAFKGIVKVREKQEKRELRRQRQVIAASEVSSVIWPTAKPKPKEEMDSMPKEVSQ